MVDGMHLTIGCEIELHMPDALKVLATFDRPCIGIQCLIHQLVSTIANYTMRIVSDRQTESERERARTLCVELEM
jgi:hypothetical protein